VGISQGQEALDVAHGEEDEGVVGAEVADDVLKFEGEKVVSFSPLVLREGKSGGAGRAVAEGGDAKGVAQIVVGASGEIADIASKSGMSSRMVAEED
jgi:hypothetical protein